MRIAGARGLLCALAVDAAGCDGAQQGYHRPCDEPAGLGAGCSVEEQETPRFRAEDACMKLAVCGVIHTTEPDPEGATPDTQTPFEACIDMVEEAVGRDPSAALLACIEEASCPDLSRTADEAVPPDADPDPRRYRIEEVLGWCGRLNAPS